MARKQRFFIIHNSVPVTPSQAGAATRTLRLKYRDPDDHHHDQCRHRVSTRDHTGIAAQSECEVRVPAAGIGKPGSGLRNRELSGERLIFRLPGQGPAQYRDKNVDTMAKAGFL